MAVGRATPLVWMSVKRAQLKGRRNSYEDTVLIRLHDVLPLGVKVTVLAGRGVANQQLYGLITDLRFDFINRFRGLVVVESRDGQVRPASAWVQANGRPWQLMDARVTTARALVDSVVCVKARGMKGA